MAEKYQHIRIFAIQKDFLLQFVPRIVVLGEKYAFVNVYFKFYQPVKSITRSIDYVFFVISSNSQLTLKNHEILNRF